MFSKWLNNYFRATGPTNIDPIHGPAEVWDQDAYEATQPRGGYPSVVIDAQDRVRAVDTGPAQSDDEYIDEVLTQVKRLNAIFDRRPDTVDIRLNFADFNVISLGGPGPKPRIVGTVGKTL